jgi:hypothetical protein
LETGGSVAPKINTAHAPPTQTQSNNILQNIKGNQPASPKLTEKAQCQQGRVLPQHLRYGYRSRIVDP